VAHSLPLTVSVGTDSVCMPPANHYRSLLLQSYKRFMNPPTSYEGWTRDDLISRLAEYDRLAASQPTVTSLQKLGPRAPLSRASSPFYDQATKQLKPFDVSKQPRRKIALRFSYSGWEYGGLAFQAKGTPLPTVEGTLFDSLSRLKLIDPALGPEGCGWERCGRTDKGVSAAGQVVSLWIRTAFGEVQGDQKSAPGTPVPEAPPLADEARNEPLADDDLFGAMDFSDDDQSNSVKPLPVPTEELHYLSMLNKTLPPTIRCTAWSPVSDTFSARFGCRSRHYKYFFLPTHLDVSRMRTAASYLLGEHDFRNLHKLDPAKQLTTFRRKILRADISPVDPDNPAGMHVLDLEGTAFLYNQVRHIMSVLFLVGSGLEHPNIVRALLNADAEYPEPSENLQSLELLLQKPDYQMADGLPLMLWNCTYAPEDISWRTDGARDDAASGSAELLRQMTNVWERAQVHAALDQHFVAAASQHHQSLSKRLPIPLNQAPPKDMLDVPLGGGSYRHGSNYIPLLERKRLDPVEVTNARWKASKDAKTTTQK
jgi:tRNA pseudouridine38/39 synthase